MQTEKAKRKIIALTFLGVALAAIMVIVLIFQLTAIFHRANRIKQLEREIAEIQAFIDSTQDELKKTESLIWLEIKARELGLIKPGDK